jgi:hypothetical protein
MSKKKLEVVSYSGYMGEEAPRAFIHGAVRVEVVEILERWKEQGVLERGIKNYFKVKGDDGLVYTLCYDEQENVWTYRRQDKQGQRLNL